MSHPVLRLQGFGVAFGERIILSSVDLKIPDREIVVLMGPGGTGKSTLLRTIAGFNNANPSLRTWGKTEYMGIPLGEGEAPALVAQSARLMLSSVLENIIQGLPERRSLTVLQQRELTERLLEEAGLGHLRESLDEPVGDLPLAVQRHIAIMRLAVAGPRLLCIDEPTSGLKDEDAFPLLDFIARERERRALLVVLHNQEHARRLGGTVALLAGGVIQETGPREEFFSAPQSTAAKDFVRSGSCSVPAPDASPANLDPDVAPPAPPPPEAREYVSDSFGPRGFLWLKKGQLAGTPRPGIVHDIDYDLKALVRVGITHLITLTETRPEHEQMAKHGISNLWCPISDMKAPTIIQAARLCTAIQDLLANGKAVAVHCRAGLGRTGTVLAAYLIWEGQEPLAALEQVRRVEPRWVQSETQVEFLEAFAKHLATLPALREPGRLAVPSYQPQSTLTTKE